MIASPDSAQIESLRQILTTRIGTESAITIAEISALLDHHCRRETEVFLEVHLADLPFCVVSSSAGYFRPASAEDINHYRNSIRSRIRCLAIRSRTVRQAAIREGFPIESGRFVTRPVTQYLPL